MWAVSLTHPLLLYVGSFSYTPLAVLCGEFLLHTPCCFMWGVSLTRPVLIYVGSFSYTPLSVLCGELLLHTPGSLCMETFLEAPHFCDQEVDNPMQEEGVLGEVCVPCLRSSKCQLSSK